MKASGQTAAQRLKLCSIFILPILLYLFFSLFAPGFGLNSIRVVLGQAVIPTLIGFGIAFGMAAGLFDLSAGARVIFAASLGGVLAEQFGLLGLIAGCVLGGVLSSVLMGLCYNLLRIPSMVLSLGFVMILEILSCYMMGVKGFLSISPALAVLGKAPWNFVICALFALVFYLLYYCTDFAYHLRAVGDNETLAKNMGIKPKRVNFISYLLGGIFLGVVGVLQISYSNSLSAVVSMGSLSMVFQPMMGVMIGIELCQLYDNMALNVIVGELCISIIFNGLVALGFQSIMQDVFLGAFMILVMSLSANRGYFTQLRARRAAKRNTVTQ